MDWRNTKVIQLGDLLDKGGRVNIWERIMMMMNENFIVFTIFK